jgi:very-short-patch-repair endonuclease
MQTQILDSDIIRLYQGEQKSARDTALELGANLKYVQRRVVKLGIGRGKAEAQALALKEGRAKHPTKGKALSDSAKKKIGQKVSDRFANLSPDEKQEIVEKSRERWNNRSDAEKRIMKDRAGKGYAKTSRNGSKIENDIADHLRTKHVVNQRVKGLIMNENLEVDIHLPQYNLIIEVDGPTHFLPIWGDNNLQRHIRADAEKSGLLLRNGYSLLRVKCYAKKVSNTKLERFIKELDVVLEEIIQGKSKSIEMEIR